MLTLVTFVLLYRIVPASHPRWRDVLPGALLATLLFEALKNSFAFYVANFNNFDVVYGSLAGALLFLLYTFLSSNILLIGAELTRTLERYHNHELDAEIFPAVAAAARDDAAWRAREGAVRPAVMAKGGATTGPPLAAFATADRALLLFDLDRVDHGAGVVAAAGSRGVILSSTSRPSTI